MWAFYDRMIFKRTDADARRRMAQRKFFKPYRGFTDSLGKRKTGVIDLCVAEGAV